MPIYNVIKDTLTEISESPFELEKNIQYLVERNIKSIFNMEFVATEFELNGLRIDSLGFDNDSKSFIIIEYKKDKNFSVIDQGYAYLSLLLNNKAEFILKYNETREKEHFLKKENVDWSQSRVIFISPQFTTYQRKAIEFKDLPIELWEVKKYSNNTILFNQIQAPEKSESITTISQKSEVIRKISQEIKVYTEDSHLEKAEENIKSIYKELKDIILSFGPSINVKPTAKYIAFIRKKNFVDIVLYKSNLTLFLNMKKGTLNDPKKIARDVSNIGHWGNGDYDIKIKDSNNLSYLTSLIRQSYDMN